jgi:hypothetical protein
MSEDSIPLTGVCTLEDLIAWLRLPFGVRNGPPAFQRAILEALAAHGLLDIIGCFIDDLATGGEDHEEGAHRARALFAMMEDWRLLAGADKVFLGMVELNFLGYKLSKGQLSPDPAKIEAIQRLQPPHTRSEARAFLGLTGYYRDFIRDYAKRSRPITLLLREDTPWEWSPDCQSAFEAL